MTPTHWTVICTRNRAADLTRTLQSVRAQTLPFALGILVIDGSDPEVQPAIAAVARAHEAVYAAYPGRPSLARQRNHALVHLPPEATVVYFLDDDVTLRPGYFAALADTLARHPEAAGAGPTVLLDGEAAPGGSTRRWKKALNRLFLIEAGRTGRVLPSGGVSNPHRLPLPAAAEVDWLCGCVAYRRSAFEAAQCDPALEGYSMDEDLDVSFRIGQTAALILDPRAKLVHHQSPISRQALYRYAFDRLVHRYWFVEKNLRHPLRKPAFWWATLGRMLLTWGNRSDGPELRRGYRAALRVIRHRDHPLLKR